MRKQIKANIIAAAASGKDLEGIFFPLILAITFSLRFSGRHS
uniref:rRNA-processing protein efg1-like n=1 Tax=Rhizophora mucronata TaxID=61149 RepID=A0A2P2KXB2_RHIMU